MLLGWQRHWGSGGGIIVVDNGSGGKRTGMVMVVRRKGMMWQHLNQCYSIWEVVGHGTGIGNMLTLFHQETLTLL